VTKQIGGAEEKILRRIFQHKHISYAVCGQCYSVSYYRTSQSQV
jgi:hypothetical protein